MIIKKFQGPSEEEAVKKAKDELGKDAVIMNVKAVKQKGLKRLFQKDYVEITAAVDEGSGGAKEAPVKPAARAFADLHPNSGKEQAGAVDGHPGKEPQVSMGKPSAIEERLDTLAQMLERQMQEAETKAEEEHAAVDQNSQMIDLVFQQLKNNEVTEENAREIVNEIDNPDQKLQLDDLLAGVYQKIVLKLGQMRTIELDEDKPKLVFFIGPTGVGKTTTIAKLASKYKLEQKCKLAIVAADTYRVAAVEQIRTYANILSVPIEVIYNAEEMQGVIEKYKDYDLVFVDTAGRSHKNEEQREDLKKLFDVVKDYNQEVYLVVSATTKYKDLVRITQVYSDISNYRLLFTKTDETAALGNILNIRMLTNRPLSYTTFGQNVPDDIEVTDAQFIAKHLLGGSE